MTVSISLPPYATRSLVYMFGFITSWHFTVYCLESWNGAVARMSSTLAPKPMVYLPGAVSQAWLASL